MSAHEIKEIKGELVPFLDSWRWTCFVDGRFLDIRISDDYSYTEAKLIFRAITMKYIESLETVPALAGDVYIRGLN